MPIHSSSRIDAGILWPGVGESNCNDYCQAYVEEMEGGGGHVRPDITVHTRKMVNHIVLLSSTFSFVVAHSAHTHARDNMPSPSCELVNCGDSFFIIVSSETYKRLDV